MPRSEAQKKADKKYHETHLKSFTVNLKVSDYNELETYCQQNGISKSKFLNKSAKYIIENEIDITDKQKD